MTLPQHRSHRASMAVMKQRAQGMCDIDDKTRYVNHTSVGWRIELEPLGESGPGERNEFISIKITRQN